MKRILLVVCLPLALASCENADRQQIGTIGGAAVGAVAGRAIGGGGTGGTIGTIVGAVAGGYLGSEIGKSLNNTDRDELSTTTQRALDSGNIGQAYNWSNSESGNRGSITPTSAAYTRADGETCRNFNTSVTLNSGRTSSNSGTACKQSDGSWRVIS